MYLETIERGTASPHQPSLLFVHGFWQAAWTWDEYVMPALADDGHHCVALSLQGHGGSDGRIRGTSIDDYVADVLHVAEAMDPIPILVGHSMGGFTVQRYLASGHPAAAAVLVSPVPASGAWGATFNAVRRRPGKLLKTNLILDVGPIVETREAAHEFLVSPRLPLEAVDQYFDRLESASYRAYLDMLLTRPDLSVVDLPAVVIGGTDDAFFSEREWRRTADRLGAELVMLPGVGHQPMWEGEATALIEELSRFVSSL